MNWHWQGSELAYLLDDSDSKVIFAHTSLIATAEAVAGDRALIKSPRNRNGRPEDIRSTRTGWRCRVHGQNRPARRRWRWCTPPAPRAAEGHRPRAVHARAVASPCGIAVRHLRTGQRNANPGGSTDVPRRAQCARARECGGGHRSALMASFDAEGLLRLIEEHQIDHFQAVPRCSSDCCVCPTRSGKIRHLLIEVCCARRCTVPAGSETTRHRLVWADRP